MGVGTLLVFEATLLVSVFVFLEFVLQFCSMFIKFQFWMLLICDKKVHFRLLYGISLFSTSAIENR